MEGTKNERSVVIIASYIIGFVTSFLLLNDYSTVENSSAVIYTTENVRDLSLSSSSDIDQTLHRTQLSLDRLKSIASKQKPTSQLRRLHSKSDAAPGSALAKLRTLRKK